jgi:hypothetical protein
LKESRVLAADLYVGVNTDMQFKSGSKYYFNVAQAGLIKLEYPSYATTKTYINYSIYKVDLETGKSSLVLHTYIPGSEAIRIGAGDYYLSFEYFNNEEIMRLDFQTEDPDCYEQEWNDSFDSSQTINSDIMYTGSLGRDAGDYYKIVLPKQGSISIYYKTENSDTFYTDCVEFYSEDQYLNTTLISAGESDPYDKIYNSYTYRVPAGTYYVKIRRDDWDLQNTYVDSFRDFYGYQFKVRYQEENPNEYESEANDSIAGANTISTNKNYTGNIQTGNDSDFFMFTVKNTSSCKLVFTQPRETKEKTFKLEVMDGDGVVLSTALTNSNPVNFGDNLILKQGNYYIKVTGSNQSDISSINYKVNMNETEIILVSKINLEPSATETFTGVTLNMKAEVLPANADKTLIWSSTDADIATVDKNGKVTCTAAGTCYIKATAADGSGISQKYKLVVKQSKINTLNDIVYDKGTLSADFSAKVTNYTLTLNKNTSSVKLTFVKSSKYSDCYVNDRNVNKVTVKLGAGKSTVLTVTIVAENGEERTYKIKIVRKS